VNVAGAFLLGYFATRLQERLPLSAYRRPLLGTGFCGALTTFSTMQLELLRMVDHARYGLAAAYAAASLALGYGAVHVATALVRRVKVVR
jgi:CrcB protein